MGRQPGPKRRRRRGTDGSPGSPAQRDPKVPADAGGKPRSLNEWVLLAVLAEEPAHGFALAKALAAEGDLGRILTVRRPLVYRALDRLADDGLAEPLQTEPGDSGPNRTVFRPTVAGLNALETWLATPVAHVRELRVEFLVKLRLLERRRRSPRRLIAAQRRVLDETIRGLTGPVGQPGSDRPSDVVDLWRACNAQAVSVFLDQLEERRPR